jgi:hypothetical protein
LNLPLEAGAFGPTLTAAKLMHVDQKWKKKLIGGSVDFEFELKSLRGNYGRLLVYVFVSRQDLNLDLWSGKDFHLIIQNMARAKNIMLAFVPPKDRLRKRN